jgi:hypothetical protein
VNTNGQGCGLIHLMSVDIYTTNLPKDECIRRLQNHAGRIGGSQQWSERTVTAKVRGDRFRLFMRGPANARNSFAPFFYGRFEEGGGKACIRGRFRMHPFVRGFLFLWFGGLMVIGSLIVLLPATAWGSGRPPPVLVVLGPAGMMLLGYGLVCFGQRLGKGQLASLRCFIERELDARPYVAESSIKA